MTPAAPSPPCLLVAPDAFKGTFAAAAVAEAIADGIRSEGLLADVCPIADGGEGTAEALRNALGGQVRTAVVVDPLERPLEAPFVVLGDGETAAIDTAAASGLPLVAPEDRDAEAATSRGTGELIAAAIDAGASKVLVAAGGSATTDGGLGAIEALRERGGMRGAELEVLCDVTTPFERAARTFGPQKGAGPAALQRLEGRLLKLAETLPRDPRGLPRTGCAGGLSGGLWATFGARLRPGAEYVLGFVEFERRLDACMAAISGEGRIDAQSLEGKAIAAVARICAERGKDLHLMVGRNALGPLSEQLSVRTIREAGSLAALTEAGREIATAIGH